MERVDEWAGVGTYTRLQSTWRPLKRWLKVEYSASSIGVRGIAETFVESPRSAKSVLEFVFVLVTWFKTSISSYLVGRWQREKRKSHNVCLGSVAAMVVAPVIDTGGGGNDDGRTEWTWLWMVAIAVAKGNDEKLHINRERAMSM